MKKHNILIVEDHALTRFALKTALSDTDFIKEIYEANDAPMARKLLEEKTVSLAIVDLGLPVIDGITLSREIRKKYPEIKIIILTSHNEKKEVLECLQMGMNAYCSKDIKPERLIGIIKDVLLGAIWFDPTVSSTILSAASKVEPKKSETKNTSHNLTIKELKVLSLIKQGDSNSDIARKLNISVNTTKVHVCAILQKLGVDDRTQAAIKAITDNIGS